MKLEEACQILSNRLREQFGLERTPKQIGTFLMVRLQEFKGEVTKDELFSLLCDLVIRLLGDPEQFQIFATDIKTGTTLGSTEGE